jgi:hypothetical protein
MPFVPSPGAGEISLDPLFTNPAVFDFSLTCPSPCIDAGDPEILDPDGSRSDIGAIPFEGGPSAVEALTWGALKLLRPR